MTAVDEYLSVAHVAEFLADDYARLRLYMGSSAFRRMAQRCVADQGLVGETARSISQRLPIFLSVTRPYTKNPELSELASVENAFNAALAAPEAPVAARVTFTQEELQGCTIEIHPSVQRMQLRTNVTSLWAALTAGELPPPPGMLDEPQELLVWRQGMTPRFRMLGQEEAVALDEAARGEPTDIAQIPENFLRGWLEAEVVSTMRVTRDTNPL